MVRSQAYLVLQFIQKIKSNIILGYFKIVIKYDNPFVCYAKTMMKCRICKTDDATKKNSHQLPSFLSVMVSSDGDYKRDKELMFTFDKFRTEVYAHGLSSTKWEETFDDLTEERLQQISINPVSEDYVFCPHCEKMLAEFLESPYSMFYKDCKNIDADIPLFFWISVAWRLSVQQKQGFSFGQELNDRLRSLLYRYLLCKENKEDIANLVKEIGISYRMVRCKDFCRTNAGFIHCRYDEKNGFFSIIVGDLCVCMNFKGDSISEHFSLYGLEEDIKNAAINKGVEREKWIDIPVKDYKDMIYGFVKHAARTRMKGLFEIAEEMWKKCYMFGCMPIAKKIAFADMVVSQETKIGDKYLPEIYIQAFKEVTSNPLI